MSETPDTPARLDRPMLGIVLMLGFCVAAPLGDAMAKLLYTMPVLALGFWRFVMQVAFMLPFAIRSGQSLRLRGRVLRLVLVRSILHIFGILCMYTALRYMPLAETVAIAFFMPFVLLLFGWLWLGEQVGPRRLIACIVGFVGTMMVIQPTFAEVGWPAILPLGVAIGFAMFMLTTRAVAHEVDPFVLQVTGGLIACAMLVPVLIITTLTGMEGMELRLPQGGEVVILLLLGLIGSFSHLLMSWALRYVPTSTVAPMQYLEIPAATLIGWLLFAQLPNGLAAAGIVVTVAAGLYVIWREQQAARARKPS